MLLTPPLQSLAEDAAALPLGVTTRCAMSNFRWESSVSDERAVAYSDEVEPVRTHKHWQSEHKSYLSNAVHIPKDLPRSAESFSALNNSSHLNEGMDNHFLLRLEALDSLLRQPLVATTAEEFWRRFYRSQKDLRKAKLSDTDEALRAEFAKLWNDHRTQARPLFATFLNAFGGNLDALVKQDWPHLLRDRLGLTHWPRDASKPLPVALVCYTVDEVRHARILAGKKGADASFTRPTVLDGEFSAAFIPAPSLPGGASYGYTLDLAGTGIPDPSNLAPELLTFPIDYQPHHIKALGYISKPHALRNDHDYLVARNRHVQGLRTLGGCGTFGEVLA